MRQVNTTEQEEAFRRLEENRRHHHKELIQEQLDREDQYEEIIEEPEGAGQNQKRDKRKKRKCNIL